MFTVAKVGSTRESGLLERFRSFIEEIAVVNCHDHIHPREKIAGEEDPLFHLLRETVLSSASDMQSAEGWKGLRAKLETVRSTSAFRALSWSFATLYDFEGTLLDETGYNRLREKMREAYSREDWYHHALRQKGNIDVVVWSMEGADLPEQVDFEIFLPVPDLEDFIYAYKSDCKARLEERYSVSLEVFSDFLELLDEAIAQFNSEGVPAVRLSYARYRHLRVQGVRPHVASQIFQKQESDISPYEANLFQDFVINFVADRCALADLPVQIDTGMYTGGQVVEQSDPSQLAILAGLHPKTRFVFLHAGFPFARNLAVMSKTFPNIFMDGSSLSTHSFQAVKEIIGEWIELVPVSKIMLWGGNSTRVEASLGSLMLMKEALAQVLAERVEDGLFSEELALDLATKLLRDTPRQFYRTDEVRIRRKSAL